MVFFTCSHCGDSIKKAKVKKHYETKCSSKPVTLTCVDCSKEFSAETYNSHASCVSEQKKNAAKGVQSKELANKGGKKQQAWMVVVKSVQSSYGKSLNNSERRLLKRLSKFDNVPRNKRKFNNFLKIYELDQNTKDSVFEKIETEFKKIQENHKNLKRGNGEATTEVTPSGGESQNKKRKKQQEGNGKMDKSQEQAKSNPEEKKPGKKEKQLNKAKQNEKENKVLQEKNEANKHQGTPEKGEKKTKVAKQSK